MLQEEVILLYEDVGRMMAKYATVQSDGLTETLKAVKDKMGRVSAGKVSVPSPNAPSIRGVQQPKAMNAPRLGFPSVPKPPSRI